MFQALTQGLERVATVANKLRIRVVTQESQFGSLDKLPGIELALQKEREKSKALKASLAISRKKELEIRLASVAAEVQHEKEMFSIKTELQTQIELRRAEFLKREQLHRLALPYVAAHTVTTNITKNSQCGCEGSIGGYLGKMGV